LELGADVVVHSGTKYLSGHQDITAGVLVAREADIGNRLATLQNTTGAVLSPFDSWLFLRGLKTLHLRVERQQESARKLASELVGFPGVKRVMYPGRGSMVAFEVDTADRIKALLERVKIWIFAESLGGTESLITVPAFQTHADVCLEVRDKLGITDRLVRLSLGLEDAQELSLDLKQALENA
jgi:cystathionine gamma-synthase